LNKACVAAGRVAGWLGIGLIEIKLFCLQSPINATEAVFEALFVDVFCRCFQLCARLLRE